MCDHNDDDDDNGLMSMGFMFDASQDTVLTKFTFHRHAIQASSPSSSIPVDSPAATPITIAMNVIDDSPGAVISGHYLWPASHLMADVLVGGLVKEATRCLELGAGCGMSGLVAAQLFTDAKVRLSRRCSRFDRKRAPTEIDP